jgi:hypothetical protein
VKVVIGNDNAAVRSVLATNTTSELKNTCKTIV